MCSNNFVDGEPTVTHPFRELKIGYEKQIPQPSRKIFKHPVPPKEAKKHIAAEIVQTSSQFRTPPLVNQEQHPEFPSEHQYYLLPGCEKCGGCVYNDILVQNYQKKLSIWQDKTENLIYRKLRLHQDQSKVIINLFTGLGIIKSFNSS